MQQSNRGGQQSSLPVNIHNHPSSQDTIPIAVDDRDQKYSYREGQGGSLDNRMQMSHNQNFVIQTAAHNMPQAKTRLSTLPA